jgi:hypothetical protein
MPELKELFDATTGHMHPPQVDPWKEQERRQVRARRTRTIGAIAVVAAIAVAVVVAAIASRPDPTAPVPATDPPAPDAVFSWGDDLTQWVTEDEMTEAIADASALYEGQGPTGEAVYEEEPFTDDGFSWQDGSGFKGAGGWRVNVHNGDHDGNYQGSPTDTDPRLPEGVSYEAEWGFGAGGYIFSAPNSDDTVAFHLIWPGGPYGEDPAPEGVHEDMVFVLASRLLREMGWADQPVFDFSEDSLCDWFTEDDMNRIVTAAQERAGTHWWFDGFDAGECSPLTPPVSTRWEWDWVASFGRSFAVGLVPVAWTELEPAERFSEHEMLDASVSYGNLEYLASWWEIMNVDLRVEGHEDEVLRFTVARQDPISAGTGGKARAASLGFAIADAMLKQMNWVESS